MAEGLQTPRTARPEPSDGPPNGGHPVTLELKVRIEAIALPEAVGGYTVIVPALPGCCTQGETVEEAMENAAEVIELWLAARHDKNREQAIRDTLG